MPDGVQVYAGTRSGLLIMEVSGAFAALSGEAFPGEIIQALATGRSRPERVFVGLRDGLYRSEDAGGHWTKALSADVRSITVDPSDDAVIYVGTDPVHLYRSEDGGESFGELESLLSLPEETHERLGEREPVDMALHFGPGFRHRRQDWWFQEPPYLGHVLQIFVHPRDPDLVMLSIEHGGVARSTDRGKSWEDVSGGIDYLDIHYVTSVADRFDRYLVTSARGLYATDDPRIGWIRSEEGCARNYFHDLTVLPAAEGGEPIVIVATADGSPGVWRRSGRGARAALYRSADGGRSWRRIGAGYGLPEEMDAMIWALSGHPGDPKTVVAAVGESSGVPSRERGVGSGSVILSDDGGETWQTLIGDLPAVEQILVTSQ